MAIENWDIIGPALGALVSGPLVGVLKSKLVVAYRKRAEEGEARELEALADNTKLQAELSDVRRDRDKAKLELREAQDACADSHGDDEDEDSDD